MNERREIPTTFEIGPGSGSGFCGGGGEEAPPASITLLMPTLNEIEGLKRVLPDLDRTLFDDILVVDGGSTDGTVEYARERGLRIERQRRPGLALGVFDAINALETTHVVEFSPDGNSLADRLPELVSRMREGYDIVTVSRYLGPAKSHDDTPVTAFGNYVFTRLIRLLGDFPVTDALVMFRGFRCDILRLPEFERTLVGPVLEPLVTAIGLVRGMRMCEIPGDEPMRIGGRSKLSIPYNGACILLMIVRLFLLRVFGGGCPEIKR
jgi:hypothetical protein